MRNSLIVLLVIVLAIIALAIGVGLAYGAYLLCLWAGAPKYVAVIVGIAVFVLGGLSARINGKK